MTVRSKSYSFASAAAQKATLDLIRRITNLNDNRGLSTAEFCRADKARGIGGVGDTPEIERQAAQHQQIDDLRSSVPGAKRAVRGLPVLGRRFQSVFYRVESFHLWLQPIAPQESRGDQRHQ